MPPVQCADRQVEQVLVDAICQGGEKGNAAVADLLLRVAHPAVWYWSRAFGIDYDELSQDLAVHLLGNEGDWARLRAWRGDSSLKTWLATITKNICLQKRRRVERAPLEFRDLSEFGFSSGMGALSPQEAECDRELHWCKVIRAGEELSDMEWRFFEAHWVERLEIEEVAGKLGISRGYANGLKHRAIEKLRKIIWGDGP